VADLDIAAFLRACLDEREAVALAAQGTTEGRWRQVDPVRTPGLIYDDYDDFVTYDESAPSEEQARHIADNDPAFVLADIAAKRLIIEQYELADGGLTGQILRNCLDTPIRLLALPFAGHPDYREEWKL